MSRKKTNILFIVMAMLAISIILGTGAYAYYRSTISGTTSGTIAKWSFKANNQTESFNLDLGSLYPGKSGTYNIELSAENSDLDVYYELSFDLQYSWDYDYMAFDSNYQNKLDYCTLRGIYGTISAGEKINVPLYYNWPYTGDDDENDATGKTKSYTFNIVAQQLTGYTGTIPMKFKGNMTYENGYIYTHCEE